MWSYILSSNIPPKLLAITEYDRAVALRTIIAIDGFGFVVFWIIDQKETKLKRNTDIVSKLSGAVNQAIKIKTQHQCRGKPNIQGLN